MNKSIIALTMAATALMAQSAAHAGASDGQINFKGEIIDSACEVINSATAPLNVTLGKVARSSFAGAGSTASPTRFSLELKNCPGTVTSATIKFDGNAVAGDNNVLALTNVSGVATGVGVQLSDASNNVLPLFSESRAYPLASGTGVNSLQFTARYIATAASITAGPADAVANFTVNYN